jgi:hypothetical protein
MFRKGQHFILSYAVLSTDYFVVCRHVPLKNQNVLRVKEHG